GRLNQLQKHRVRIDDPLLGPALGNRDGNRQMIEELLEALVLQCLGKLRRIQNLVELLRRSLGVVFVTHATAPAGGNAKPWRPAERHKAAEAWRRAPCGLVCWFWQWVRHCVPTSGQTEGLCLGPRIPLFLLLQSTMEGNHKCRAAERAMPPEGRLDEEAVP